MSETLMIGDLWFDLRRSPRRKTVGITVDRGGELVVSAPDECPLEVVESSARAKLFWIYTKLARKEQLLSPTAPKEFVSGETFYYLGRSYRLRLIAPPETAAPALRLHHGRFLLRRDERECAPEHFIRWYIGHGRPWLERRAALFAGRIGVAPAAVEIRDLGFRWGSCGRGGRVNVHWRTVLLPPRIIDYIVAHELVHLCQSRHDREFWRCLERAMPDFAARKQWLAEHGGRFY